MVSLTDLSVVAVLAAAVANQALGFFWYHPKVFGAQWMKLVGRRPDEMGDPKQAILLSTLASLLSALALAVLVLLFYDGQANWVDGLGIGALVAVGFIVPVLGTDAAYSGKSFSLYFLNATYYVIGTMAMGAVVGALQ